MKRFMFVLMFITFISIFSLLLYLVNAYVYQRMSVLFSTSPVYLTVFKYTFILLAVAFIAGRLLERLSYSAVSTFLINSGSIWLGFLVYAFLLFALTDLIFLISGFKSTTSFADYRVWSAALVCILTLAICTYGYYNSKNSRVTTIKINIDKRAGELRTLNVVSVSDIHLGTLIKNSRIRHIVDKINALHPDIVLLPGDVVDEDLAPVIKHNMANELARLKAKYGVFAITGNHEYIGGAEAAVHYLSQYHIKYLRDQAVLVNNSFYLVGREDRSRDRFTGVKRLPLQTILNGINKSLPIILMDHQPVNLEAAVDSGVDFQISGHTHHGQMFPFNFITELIFQSSWGYLKKGSTHFYVSCGAGTWGPPMRIGSYSEIVNTIINFNHDKH